MSHLSERLKSLIPSAIHLLNVMVYNDVLCFYLPVSKLLEPIAPGAINEVVCMS